MMNRFIILLLIIAVSAGMTFSQDKRKQSDKKGTITGIIIDDDSKSPIESVTVQIFKMKDSSLVTGTTTDKEGKFLIGNVPMGRFKLKASFIGYSTAVMKDITLFPQNPDADLGVIKLVQTEGPVTSEIEVTAEAPVFENQIDKKVYNVEKTIVSESGSAVDVLKNVPSVTVDADGNVSLRGSSNVKILINGKPSAMLGSDPASVLEQIPSKIIESVEVMNNPSSKYDPEGTAGIINIILKKQQDDGYHGVFSVNIGTGDKYNSSINFNVKKNKFNFFGSYNYRLFHMSGNGATNKQTLFNDSIYYNNQTSTSKARMNSHMGSLGLDFEPDKKNLFTLSGNYSNRDRIRTDLGLYQNLNSLQQITYIYNRNSVEEESGNGLDIHFTHKRKFDKKKEELNSSFQYSRSSEDEPSDISQYNYLTGNPTLLQIDTTTYSINTYTVQSDFFNPIGYDNKSKFEAGVKAVARSIVSDYYSNYYDFLLQKWVYNNLTSNNFQYNDQIYSVYVNYGNTIKKFGYQFGLRLEQAFTKSKQLTLNQDYEKNYFSFFPSIYLTQTFAKTNEIQLSYTRRINRPNTHVLNPFIDYTDPQNLRKGNPYLNPEYINAFEFSYMKYLSTMSVSGAVFYRRINDVINRIITLVDSTTSLITFENISKSSAYGLEFVVTGSITKWWSLNGSASYSKTQISGTSSTQGALDNTSDAWSGKLMTSFTFPKIFDFQIAYFYTGRMITAQGSMDPMQAMDIAIKKDFFNKKASLTLRIADALNTQKFAMQANTNNIDIMSVRRRDSRNVFLTLSYRFGNDQPR
ncbi:TonB-dependent receptor, partial [bacterium]